MKSAHIIRVDGSEQYTKVAGVEEVRKLISADALDGVNLRDGRYMFVDDTGLVDGKDLNDKATALYRGVCRAGSGALIAGDVCIVVDSEWA